MADVNQQPKATDQRMAETPRKLSKNQKRKSRKQKNRDKQPKPERVDYKTTPKENEAFSKFYKAQPFLNDEEFEAFMAALRQPLPAAFRINCFELNQATFLRQLIRDRKSQFSELPFLKLNDNTETTVEQHQDGTLKDSNHEANAVTTKRTPPTTYQSSKATLESLTWYPKEFGWQMDVCRNDLRKSPFLQELHKFIMAETENGFISRQEVVSMLPPLVLDVHRGHNVLDMCAAPGSKTAQLLEYLKFDIMDTGEHAKVKNRDHFDHGMVVANDVDNSRCYMLVHQSSRLNSPNCVIINQDASRMPDMKTFDNNSDELYDLKFDRVLCDVPCSGDGTLRKNLDIWRKWNIGLVNSFHGLQARILRRGLELLKENGIVVYSTCSMNPIEDEAVISSILQASQGSVILEDVSNKLTGLKYRPGVSNWVVMSRDMEVITGYDQIKPEQKSYISPGFFPPTEEVAKGLNLNRCIRVLPHLQNTGAFFVAVLRKLTSKLPWEESTKNQIDEPNKQPPKKRRFDGFKEEPFYFMDDKDPDWVNLKNTYELSDDFPVNQLLHRSVHGRKRSIYLVSKMTRSFLIANQEEPGRTDFVKIINGGMRLFSKAQSEAGFRICQDGAIEILPHLKDDLKVPINKNDLIALIKARSVPIESVSTGDHIREKVKPGSVILMYKHEDEKGSFEMPLVAWRGEKTVTLYVSNTYRIHLCALVQLKMSEDAAYKSKQDTTKD